MAPNTTALDIDDVVARLAAIDAAHERVATLHTLLRDAGPDPSSLWSLAERLKDEADQSRYRDTALSLRWSDDVVALGQLAGVPTISALGRMAAGLTLYELGRYDESLTVFDEAAAIFAEHGHEAGWARTQIGRTATCMALARFDEALERAERAREILARTGDRRRAAIVDNNLALLLERMNRPAEALHYSRQALASYREREASKDAVDALSNHALLLWRLGQAREALALHQQARDGYAAFGAVVSAAQEDLNIGAAQLSLGYYAEAITSLTLARRQLLSASLPNVAAFAGLYLAECFVRVGRFYDALEMAQTTQRDFAGYGDVVQVAQAMQWEAVAHAGLRQHDAALGILDAASRLLHERTGLDGYQPITDVARAQLLLHAGRPAEAGKLLLPAIPALQAAGLLADAATAQALLAEASLAQGRRAQALRAARRALTVAQRVGLDTLLARALHVRGRIEAAAGDDDRAGATLANAVRHLDLVSGRVAWDDHAAFAGTAIDVYADAMQLALRRRRPALALRYAERARARALADHLRIGIDVRPRARDEHSRALVGELVALRERYAWLTAPRNGGADRGEPIAAVRWAAGAAPDSAAWKEASEIERRMAGIWRELQAANPAYRGDAAALDVVPPLDVAAPDDETEARRWVTGVQDALGDDGVALLEYAALGDDLVLFVLRDGAVSAVRLDGAAAQVRRLVPLLRLNVECSAHAVGSGDGALRALAGNATGLLRRLYGVLLAPAVPLLDGVMRLVVAPQGAGHHVPFQALHDGTGYLIERYEVSYVPCASLVGHFAARQRRLCEDALVRERGALALTSSNGGALPHVSLEGRAVVAALGGRLLHDEQATASALRATLSGCEVLHVAAHAVFRPDEPLFSTLYLGDGRLSTMDVFELELDCSLVTLSACETSLGVQGAGDELMGLSRAFLYAGAPSLLLSLWKVEDRSTAALMAVFYRGLGAGQGKAAALRQAQLALLHGAAGDEGGAGTDYRAPYFWAPFHLIGHGGPLPRGGRSCGIQLEDDGGRRAASTAL